AGSIIGGIIGALVAVLVVLAVFYYIFRVKGVKLSRVSLPSRSKSHVDVPAFNNPNFAGESET
ncbi:macrophage mannose receptor 1, partial [Tachysurus ichikawai]